MNEIQFNGVTYPLVKGQVTMIASRPGMGKTQAMVNFANEVTGQGDMVGYFSLEESRENVQSRLGGEVRFILDDTASMSVEELCNRAKMMVEQNEVKFIVVDYLHLLSGDYNLLDDLAAELDIPVIVLSQVCSDKTMTNFEQGKRAALEAVSEIFERIEKANGFLEKAREEKNLVEFVYWFVLIHEYYYMLQKPLFSEELERIYAEMERYNPIDYLKHKRKQCYERLPDFHTTYGRGYNFPDIIGCALSNRYEEEIFTFYPNIKKMFCGGTLERQNLMLHFLQRGENREQIDYCDVCGKNLNDQPYPYTYRCTTCGRTFNLCAKCSEGQTHKYWGEVGRKAHDDYEELVHSRMFQQEQLSHRQYEIDQMFADKGMLEFTEGGKVNAREIVSVLNTVVGRIKCADESFYRRYLQKSVILYTYNDQNIKTVCVDERNNVYVSANYLYNVLKMDEELIYALFMNVAYRIKNDYFTEERRFLSKGMQRTPFRELGGGPFTAVELTKPLHHDMNIALDLHINDSLINSEILSYDSLKNKLNAVCLKNENILSINRYYYHKKMGEIRDEINLTFPIVPSYKPIPDTFIAGYRHTRIKIGRLVTNYGEVHTYEKLTPIIKKL